MAAKATSQGCIRATAYSFLFVSDWMFGPSNVDPRASLKDRTKCHLPTLCFFLNDLPFLKTMGFFSSFRGYSVLPTGLGASPYILSKSKALEHKSPASPQGPLDYSLAFCVFSNGGGKRWSYRCDLEVLITTKVLLLILKVDILSIPGILVSVIPSWEISALLVLAVKSCYCHKTDGQASDHSKFPVSILLMAAILSFGHICHTVCFG